MKEREFVNQATWEKIRTYTNTDREAYHYLTADEVGHYLGIKGDTVRAWTSCERAYIDTKMYFRVRDVIKYLGSPGRSSTTDLNTSRRDLNKAQERKVRLSTLELEKKLVPTKEVEFIVTNMVTELKQNMMALPSRIIDDLMLCKGKEEMKDFLEKMIANTLEGMSSEFSLKAQKSNELLSAADINLFDLEDSDETIEEA